MMRGNTFACVEGMDTHEDTRVDTKLMHTHAPLRTLMHKRVHAGKCVHAPTHTLR